jgi:hypothetical protein
MKKTLKLIEKAYSLLEAAPFPEAGEDQNNVSPTGVDATAPPPTTEPQETQKLTSQAEVNMIQKLVTLLQTAVTSEPDENTKSMIVNFDVDSITPENARDMLKKFEDIFTSNKTDFETAKIDNQYGL